MYVSSTVWQCRVRTAPRNEGLAQLWKILLEDLRCRVQDVIDDVDDALDDRQYRLEGCLSSMTICTGNVARSAVNLHSSPVCWPR